MKKYKYGEVHYNSAEDYVLLQFWDYPDVDNPEDETEFEIKVGDYWIPAMLNNGNEWHLSSAGRALDNVILDGIEIRIPINEEV